MGVKNMFGALCTALGLDSSDFDKGLDKAEKRIDEFGGNVTKSGEALNKAFDLSKTIQIQKQAISELEKQYIHAKAEFDKVNIGTSDPQAIEARKKASTIFKEVKAELQGEKDVLAQLEKQYKEASRSLETYTVQMRKLREEMAHLVNADGTISPENIKQYDELKTKLAEVSVAYKRVQNEQRVMTALGSAQLSGIIQGLSALSGAFAAGQGVTSLFVKDNERLMAIQTKLQAAMSITFGLQQASNALSATSAFRTQTVAKAVQLWTSATNRLTVALGGSTVAAQILMATITLGVSVGITALIYLIDKYSSAQAKAREDIKQFNQSVASSSNSLRAEFEKLRREWALAGEDLKKKEKLILENSAAYDKLGVSINNVEEADKIFRDNTSEFIKSIDLRAKAAAAMDIASEKYKEAIQKMLDAEKRVENPSFGDKTKGLMTYLGLYRFGIGTEHSLDEMTKSWSEKGAAEDKEEADKLEKEAVNLIAKSIGWSANANSTLEALGVKSKESLKEGTKAWYQEIQKNRQKALDEMTKDELKSTTGLKLKNERDAAAKIIQSWDKTPIVSADKLSTLAQKKLNAEQWLLNKQKELANEAIRFELEAEQKKLDITEDSFQKQLDQSELNYRKSVLERDRFEAEMEAKQVEFARKAYEKEQGSDKGFDFKKFDKRKLPIELQDATIKQQIKELTKAAQAASEKADMQAYEANKKRIEDLLSKHQDYNARRIAIDKQYQKELEDLNKLSDSEQKKAAIAQLEKNKKASIKVVNEEESAELVKTTDLFVRLFRDASQQSVREIRKVINETQALFDYLNNTKIDDLTPNFGLTTEQLRALKVDTEQLKAILNGLTGKQTALGSRSPALSFFDKMKNSIEQINKGLDGMNGKQDESGKPIGGIEDIGMGISGIGSSIDAMMPQLKKFGEDMGVIFGDDVGHAIQQTAELTGAVAELGEGVGKIMSGDIVGGIQSTVSSVARIFTMSKKVKDMNRQVREEIQKYYDEAKKGELEYQMLLRQRARDEKQTNEAAIKHNQRITKELDAQRLANQAKSKELMEQLQKEQYVADKGYRHGTLFRKAKSWDIMESLQGKTYEEIEALYTEGKLTEKAKELFEDLRKLKDEGADIDAMLTEQAQSYAEYISGLSFDSLKDSIKGFFDDWKMDAKEAADFTKNIFKKAILQSLEAKLLEEQLKPFLDSFQKDAIDGTLFDKKEYYENWLQKIADDGNAYMEGIKNIPGMAEIFNDRFDQKSSSRGFETMTQDQAGELNGRFTGVYESLIRTEAIILLMQSDITRIREYNFSVAESVLELKDAMRYCLDCLEVLVKSNNELYEINEGIKEIKKNTKGLINR